MSNCPGYNKPIDMSDVRRNRSKYYLDANMCGVIWHLICLNRVLAGWVEGMTWIRKRRRGFYEHTGY